jgi:hypothetical protein
MENLELQQLQPTAMQRKDLQKNRLCTNIFFYFCPFCLFCLLKLNEAAVHMPTGFKREEIMLCTINMNFCKLEFKFLIGL